LSVPAPANRDLRIVFKISTSDKDAFKGMMYSIDQPGPGIAAGAVTLQGSTVKLTVPAIGGNYEGKMSPDGSSITGSWTQGPNPLPLNLMRASPETAWTIPDPPPPPKQMPADAKPVFEVATIKPSPPDARGSSILVGRGGGNLFTTTSSSLKDLIVFAYGLHARQVGGGPAWVENDRYDITGKPDLAGMPSVTQLQAMVQKLLTERFELSFHREKKELSVYAITVAKTGLKLTKAEGNNGNLPGFGGRGPGSVGVFNSTMSDFAGFLQSRILDRPVVDQTGLSDRYTFTLTWQPDVAQPPPTGQPAAPPPSADADALPDLFTAFQKQLGLKLEATKAPVDVLVIDKVEKPSAN
jgi:uncharacterized protein (TIGR03435 family)